MEGEGLLAGIGTAIVLVLAAALYAPVLADLASEWWTRPEASYGMLIPPFALYLAYLKRHDTLALPAVPDWHGLGLVAVACLTFLGGALASEFFLSRLSFVVLLTGLVWTFWGTARLRSLCFPLIFLATMIPPPEIVYNAAAAPLQLLASDMAGALAQQCGVSVFRDGNMIYLAHVTLGVAEACSGLHSLSALAVASLLLGFLKDASWIGRGVLFLLSVPLAIAVNILRITGTAILADWWPPLALGFYHGFSGWLVFVVGLGILWLAARIILRTRKHAI
jgi:exosortase